MSDAERIAAFMRLAEEEMGAARLLSTTAPRQAAYFLQQAAEKATRAVLTEAGIAFGTSHNLGQMAAALPREHPLRSTVNGLDRYSTAATKFRYPSPTGRLTPPPSQDFLIAGAAEVAGFIEMVKRYLASAARRPSPPPP